MHNSKILKLTLAALFSAIAFLTVFLFRIPVVLFLKYEAKDAVIALEALILGPWYAVITSFVVSLIEMVTISGTGPIGAVMNVLSTVTYILPAALLYKRKKTLPTAVTGLVLGAVIMTAGMLLWNYLITPWYMETPREVVADMLLPYFLPFNLLKGILNTAVTLLLYKPIMNVLRKAGLLPKSDAQKPQSNLAITINIIAVIVIAIAAVVLILINA
ncbi:MAG: energy coupling factor transporter S component ThiW [Oscillospiraceae bacterium]|nr:energy coupling factor transporter S component ThiW [Oscillospiraceae bacterium]